VAVPIRLRLALVSAVLVSALVAGLGVFVYLRLEADLRASVDDGLTERAQQLVDEPPAGPAIEGGSQDIGDVFAAIVDSGASRPVATTSGFPAMLIGPTVLTAGNGARVFERTIPGDDGPSVVRVYTGPAHEGRIVVTGVSFDDQRDSLDALRDELLVALPIAAALALAVGWLVGGGALRPVEQMRLEAEAISESEPSRRLTVPATRDELASLGTSLNRMLGRLEAGVERERRLVDDASHELRTPLANLRAELDLALRRARTEAELLAAIKSASEEADRLSRLANDLLELSRSHGGLPVHREDVAVETLLAAAIDAFAARAESAGIDLATDVSAGTRARIDPGRIRQAVDNLLDNAIRHTPSGGRIRVLAEAADGELRVQVADTGSGFAPGFEAVALEPFTRADEGRAPDAGGTGLGLAIVQAIAKAHDGRVAISNDPSGGAVVEIRLRL
jgi:two-component system OmpR family sensor kinase